MEGNFLLFHATGLSFSTLPKIFCHQAFDVYGYEKAHKSKAGTGSVE